jgi:hypothetical protein
MSKDIVQVGPLQRGRISFISGLPPLITAAVS